MERIAGENQKLKMQVNSLKQQLDEETEKTSKLSAEVERLRLAIEEKDKTTEPMVAYIDDLESKIESQRQEILTVEVENTLLLNTCLTDVRKQYESRISLLMLDLNNFSERLTKSLNETQDDIKNKFLGSTAGANAEAFIGVLSKSQKEAQKQIHTTISGAGKELLNEISLLLSTCMEDVQKHVETHVSGVSRQLVNADIFHVKLSKLHNQIRSLLVSEVRNHGGSNFESSVPADGAAKYDLDLMSRHVNKLKQHLDSQAEKIAKLQSQLAGLKEEKDKMQEYLGKDSKWKDLQRPSSDASEKEKLSQNVSPQPKAQSLIKTFVWPTASIVSAGAFAAAATVLLKRKYMY